MLKLSKDQQRLAAAFLCEISFCDFERFCQLTDWPYAHAYRTILDSLWDALAIEGPTAKVAFNESIIPDEDKFSEWEVALACDAGIALQTACCKVKPLKRCLEIADASTDQVSYALELGEEAFLVISSLIVLAVDLLENEERGVVIDKLRKLPANRWNFQIDHLHVDQ